MLERQPTPILLDQREGGGGDVRGIDAQTDSQASHERCLAGPEGTDEQHDIAGAKARRQARRRRLGLALTSRGDD